MSIPRPKRVNLADIAERLGLAASTVSRALRGVEGIHPETRAQIAAVAQQMGYVTSGGPSPEVAEPPVQTPRNVLILSQRTNPQNYQNYMAGMSAPAASLNVAIHFHFVALDQCASVLDERVAPASLRSGLIDGIVLLSRWPAAVAESISAKFPTASLAHDYPGTSIDLISSDDRRGVADLVDHLYASGHRRIGFFGLCPEVTWSCSRYGAYLEALTRHGLVIDPRLAVRIALPTALSGSEFRDENAFTQVKNLLSEGVDAWVCPSAMTGQSLCRHLLANGVRLPEDMSLVSYHGNSCPSSADLPVISTSEVVDEEMGAATLRRLINRLEAPGESRQTILLPSRLVVGATSRIALP